MNFIWTDRKRHFGLPISFTKYSLNENRIFMESGFLNLKEEEILLYRVRDLTLTRNLWQRLFRVGTIIVYSSDKTAPCLKITNVKHSKKVKETIFEYVEAAKIKRRLRATELLEDSEMFDSEADI